MRKSLTKMLSEYVLDAADISEQHSILSLLYIYRAHIGCLRPMFFSIKDIMSREEQDEQMKLIKELDKLMPDPNQKQQPTEEDNIE